MKRAADKNLKDEAASELMLENGIEVSGKEAVLEAYREEFKHRLRTREPHDGWIHHVEEVNRVIRNWLKGPSATSPPFDDSEIDAAISKLKKGKCPGVDDYPPDLFIQSGKGVRTSLRQLFNQIKESREIPDQWNYMKIVTIYKQKGSKKMLKYYRGIFLAIVVSKIFESLIKARIEPNLGKVNLLQAGSRSKRGPADNVFLLRGCVDHHVANKKPLFITAYDYEQAFDSLWVEKCIMSLRNLGVSKEMLQLVYNLNKKAHVVVQTPYGLTRPFETDPIVKQGTVLGSSLCSSLTGEYCGINAGIDIGGMLLSSLLYVDDVLDITENLIDRLEAHKQALIFEKQNNVRLSGSKCYSMALNFDEDVPILMIDDEKFVIPAEEIVYLGDPFNIRGDNDSLVQDRIRRGTKAIICITSLIQETNLGIHETSVWLLLYRSLFLSTVLFNSQTWSRLRTKDVNKLKVMQQKFLKRIFSLPSSTPNSFLFLELGVLPIEVEINKRQLMYLHRILQLPNDDPVHQMFDAQVALDQQGEENWWTGVKALLTKYGLPQDLNLLKQLSKDAFKRLVSRNLKEVVFESLVAECKSLKKTANLTYTSFGMQYYLKHLFPNQAKHIIRSRCQILDLKSHNTYKFKGDTSCRRCGVADETLEHVINCQHEEILDVNLNNVEPDEEQSDLKIISITKVANRIQTFFDSIEDRET